MLLWLVRRSNYDCNAKYDMNLPVLRRNHVRLDISDQTDERFEQNWSSLKLEQAKRSRKIRKMSPKETLRVISAPESDAA